MSQSVSADDEPLAVVPVPLLDLKKNYESIMSELDAAALGVLASGYYINGPAVKTFEEEFAAFVGTKHCVGLCTGTDALMLALEAFGIGPGDEVITQGNAYIADGLAVEYAGATLVLADQDMTFQFDLDKLEAAITSKTKCVIAVHMYGACCDMDRLVDICRKHRLWLIEDCAHAHGSTWNGKKLGSFCDIACWSFYPGKNLGAAGDGGGCTTNSDHLDRALRLLRNYGSERKYYNDSIGRNARLDTIQAAILSVKLRHLPQWNARRLEIAKAYKDALGTVGDITFPVVLDGCVSAYHQFVLMTSHREALLHWLNVDYKVDSIMHYPVPIHRQKAFAKYASAAAHLPLSDSLCHRILSLPMCPMMTDDMVNQVIRVVRRFFTHGPGRVPAIPPTPAAATTATSTAGTSAPAAEVNTPRIISNRIRDVTFGKGVTIVEPTNMYECHLADNVFVGPFVEIQGSVSIGARTRVQSHTFICEFVTIGEDCFIGHSVSFVNDLLKGSSFVRADREHKILKTSIGKHVAIGTNATILPVSICDYVIIGAGSVVTKNITESGVYAGNPARRIGDYDPNA